MNWKNAIKNLLLTGFVISMTGCAATEGPSIDYSFAKFETIQQQPTYPEQLPRIDELECFDASCQTAGYSRPDQIDKLERYQIIAEANTEIAKANAQALEYSFAQTRELVIAGKVEEELHRIREEQLRFEQRQRIIDRWYYRAMLVLVGAAGIIASR